MFILAGRYMNRNPLELEWCMLIKFGKNLFLIFGICYILVYYSDYLANSM